MLYIYVSSCSYSLLNLSQSSFIISGLLLQSYLILRSSNVHLAKGSALFKQRWLVNRRTVSYNQTLNYPPGMCESGVPPLNYCSRKWKQIPWLITCESKLKCTVLWAHSLSSPSWHPSGRLVLELYLQSSPF